MKTIVAGSRSILNRKLVYQHLDSHREKITEVVSGMALDWKWHQDPQIGGPDRYGHDWAKYNGILVKPFRAAWGKEGKMAGYHRNLRMAKYADSLICFWDGKSPGAKHMIDIMEGFNKPVITIILNNND